MYVLCDPLWRLEESFWFRGSYADSLKFFFTHFNSKEVIVFRDVRGKGRLNDLQFLCTVQRKNLQKLLSTSPRA